MAGVNKVTILGRLGADPELKTLNSGAIVASFSVATSQKWKDQSGNMQERTEWHRITVWNKLAQLCGQYLKKGRQVYLEGELRTRSWEKDGEKRYATEILAQTVQFIGDAPGGGQRQQQSQEEHGAQGGSGGDFGQFGAPSFDSNEEIPF